MSYKTVHARMLKEGGLASKHMCSSKFCVRRARYWALNFLANPDDLRIDSVGCVYSLDTSPDTYVPMCPQCHSRFDRMVRQTLEAVMRLRANEPLSEEDERIADGPSLHRCVNGVWLAQRLALARLLGVPWREIAR